MLSTHTLVHSKGLELKSNGKTKWCINSFKQPFKSSVGSYKLQLGPTKLDMPNNLNTGWQYDKLMLMLHITKEQELAFVLQILCSDSQTHLSSVTTFIKIMKRVRQACRKGLINVFPQHYCTFLLFWYTNMIKKLSMFFSQPFYHN